MRRRARTFALFVNQITNSEGMWINFNIQNTHRITIGCGLSWCDNLHIQFVSYAEWRTRARSWSLAKRPSFYYHHLRLAAGGWQLTPGNTLNSSQALNSIRRNLLCRQWAFICEEFKFTHQLHALNFGHYERRYLLRCSLFGCLFVWPNQKNFFAHFCASRRTFSHQWHGIPNKSVVPQTE